MWTNYRALQIWEKIKKGTARFQDLAEVADLSPDSYYWNRCEVRYEKSIEDILSQMEFQRLNFTRTYPPRQINEIMTIAMLENCGDAVP